MQTWKERYYDKLEARKEGLAEGRANLMKELIMRKLQKGKSACVHGEVTVF